MNVRTREIAKAGIYGSKDEPVIVTEKDLEEIAETFSDIRKVPIRLGGHWSYDRPRLGSVVAVRYDAPSKTLIADIEEQDELSAAVDEGYYPDVSIGAKQRASDGKMYLHHLAYLGEEPPAIKDLQNNIQESLSEAELNVAASDNLRVIRYPPYSLYLSDNIQHPAGKPAKEQSMELSEEIAALKAENEALKAANAQKEKLLSDAAKERREAAAARLKKAAEGKVPQAQLENLLALSASLDDGRAIECADGSTADARAILAAVFESLPKRVAAGALELSDVSETQAPENLSARMMAHV